MPTSGIRLPEGADVAECDGDARAVVASRVVDILEAFSEAREGLTLSAISKRVSLPLTTTHRLVTELAARRLLERDDEGRYHAGLRLWELAAHAPRTVGLRDAALPFLEDLYEATHDNVQLAVMDGLEVVYLERIAGRHSVHVVSRVGGRSRCMRQGWVWCRSHTPRRRCRTRRSPDR